MSLLVAGGDRYQGRAALLGDGLPGSACVPQRKVEFTSLLPVAQVPAGSHSSLTQIDCLSRDITVDVKRNDFCGDRSRV